jgi:hypothetical protein
MTVIVLVFPIEGKGRGVQEIGIERMGEEIRLPLEQVQLPVRYDRPSGSHCSRAVDSPCWEMERPSPLHTPQANVDLVRAVQTAKVHALRGRGRKRQQADRFQGFVPRRAEKDLMHRSTSQAAR